MKKIYSVIACLLMTASVFLPQQASAQAPEKMSYQAVVRDGSNALVTSTAVGMQISILQGSASGTAVYVETQTPTTNAKGLVSLEIGTGTVESGTFATIDWSAGSYFIKTETDPTGGANYTITGTSQLLSVPYALHAKTAESVTGTIIETDPAFVASQAKNITSTDITNLGKLSGTNTGDQDLSALATKTSLDDLSAKLAKLELKVQLLSGVSVTDLLAAGVSVTDLLAAGVSVTDLLAAGASVADLIGKEYQGGKIAYILQSGDPGYDANVAHGIIAAPSDQSTGIQWYNGSFTVTGATATALGTGNANTNTIVTNQGAGSYAAKLCNDLVLGGYSDWYLPSKDELNKLFLNRTAVGGFASAYYWSSTESSTNYAWLQNFDFGYQSNGFKFNSYRVRAVRAF